MRKHFVFTRWSDSQSRQDAQRPRNHVQDGAPTPSAFKPWVHKLDARLTRLEMEAELAESFNRELLATIVKLLRQRNQIISVALLWLIGQLAANPLLQRNRLLDRLVAAIEQVRKETAPM
jgi:hypothetical protein